jgi:hypothetical protein
MKWNEYLLRFLAWIGAVTYPQFIARTTPTHPTPADLAEGRLVIVRDGALMKTACFHCPGGCGLKIMLALSPKRLPHWQVRIDWLGRPSVEPSVRQLNDCECHFWIRNGRVEWCGDSRRGGQ